MDGQVSISPKRLDKPVIIIGAGPVGLALAQGLKRKGIDFLIFEQKSEVDEQGWAVTVNEQGLRQLASLLHNSRSAIEATSVIEYHRDDHQQLHFDASVGKAAYKRTPFRRVRADRKKLCNVLRHGLHVLYDKSLDKVEILEDAIRARFLDGSVVDGLCIIGADGALSQVRAQICGSQVALRTTLPISALACTIYLTHEEAEPLLALHELIISASHPAERSFVYISRLSQTRIDGEPRLPFQICHSWHSDPKDLPRSVPQSTAERIQLLQDLVRNWAEPFRSMYDSLEVGKSQVHVVRMTEWLPKNWNNRQGRVTLVGDAAHQFPPYRGEAINHGFVDAATLARLLGCADDANDPSYTASQAIHDYEALMLPRAQMAVILSREAMYNAHDWSRLGAGPLYGQTWSEELGWFGDDTGIVLADDDGYPQFEEDAERMCKSPELNHCYNDGSTARNEAQARRGLESQQVTMKLVEEAQGSQSMGPI